MSKLLLEVGFEATLKRARDLLDSVWNWDGEDERKRAQTVTELTAIIDALAGFVSRDDDTR